MLCKILRNFFINIKWEKRYIIIYFYSKYFLGGVYQIYLMFNQLFYSVFYKWVLNKPLWNTLEIFKLYRKLKNYTLPHKSVSDFQAKSLLLAFPLCISQFTPYCAKVSHDNNAHSFVYIFVECIYTMEHTMFLALHKYRNIIATNNHGIFLFVVIKAL